ncbi:MAG: low temperature requirement protein A [Acidimicrobiales bacterium]|jgi:low temperature requirement protein LtrA|nr:low temperature requirement protein A [Acidimicrobiales bacterium]
MRGIEVPERTEDFTADPVELFFDLAYVFAFSQLVGRLIAEPDWEGVGRVTLLFLLLWLPWQQFTWSANAVSGNGRTVRVFFLVATVASVPMAASISTAFGPGGPVFALSLGVIMVIGLATQLLGHDRSSSEFGSVVRWAAPNVVGLAVIVGGSFVDGAGRTVLWIVAVLITIGAMIAAGRGEWIIRTGHFAERHGLIVIVALGEVIVALGLPVVSSLEAGGGVPGSTVAVLVAAGVFAGLLWWGYFDRPSPALEHRAESLVGARERGRYVRDVYTWAHAPVVAGVILSAAALEEIALHPTDPVPQQFRVMLLGGLVLMVVGIAVSVWRAFRAVPIERLVALGALAAVLLGATSWNGLVVVVVVDVVVFVTFVIENRRIEHPRVAD